MATSIHTDVVPEFNGTAGAPLFAWSVTVVDDDTDEVVATIAEGNASQLASATEAAQRKASAYATFVAGTYGEYHATLVDGEFVEVAE